MANTRELRRRIKSVKSTAQITKAMQMVAATKMRKAQSQALNGRPYSLNLSEALGRLLPLVNIESHPLLKGNSSQTQGVVLLSTDKSLCGALNTNLFRLLMNSDLMDSRVIFYTVGKKGRNFIARTGQNLQADFENVDIVTFRQAKLLAKLAADSFLKEEIREAYIVYPHFGSTLRQESMKVKLLPIELESVIASPEGAWPASPAQRGEQSSKFGESDRSGKIATVATLPRDDKGKEFLFEPDPDKLLDYILVHHVQIKIYQALLETKASEHSARMIAMQNATDNALELVEDLNLTYNQTRQEGITKELLEITTAAMVMG